VPNSNNQGQLLISGTNQYFNHMVGTLEEQTLIEDLTVEAIKIYGHNVVYIPRNIVSRDNLYTEDDQSEYTDIYPIEMYIKSVDGFEGDGIFLSKFGLEIRDQVTFTVARRIFADEVTTPRPAQLKPNEGDVIFFPMNSRLFQIKYVDYKPMFYQLGALYVYDLVCELFEYSGEKFNTGVAMIDAIQRNYSTNIFDYAIMTEEGEMLRSENGGYIVSEQFNVTKMIPGNDSDWIQNEADFGTETDQPFGNNSIIDWTRFDPFSERRY